MSFYWVNGEFLLFDDVKISPLDHGLVTGDGLFEVLAGYHGEAFAVTRHIERLKKTASSFFIQTDALDRIDWRQAIRELLKKNNLDAGLSRIRVTVTTGDADLGSDRGNKELFVMIAAGPMPKMYEKGALSLVPWPRNEKGALSGMKTTSYGENVKALFFAKQNGCNEALFLNTQEHVCEGTGTNVFWIKNGKLFTPDLSSGCLAGVTRALVIKRATALGLELFEGSYPLKDILEADAVFLTSTLREVQWVENIDSKKWDINKLGVAGEIIQKLKKDFVDYSRKTLDP